MDVLYVITQADGGGAQKYTLALARHFQGMIAAGNKASQLFEGAKAAGLETFELKHLKRNIHPWHDLLAIFEIARLIKKLQPDIVHLNSTKAGFLGSIAGKIAKNSITHIFSGRQKHGPKIVFTAHGFRFLEPLSPAGKRFYLLAEKFASRCRDFIIAVSDVDRRAAIDQKIIDSDKIATIHNGVPSINFLPADEAKRALGLPAGKTNLGAIGGFYKTKGFDVLIQAIAKLDEAAKTNLCLMIIGSGPEFENCKLKVDNLKLGSVINLPGKVGHASAYLQAFDVLVIPSRKEGLPFVLLEAMQAGLPIIAARVGGIPEALSDAGILVEPEAPSALAEAVTKLVNDKSLANELANRAKQRSAEFTEERMLKATEQVYRRLVI